MKPVKPSRTRADWGRDLPGHQSPTAAAKDAAGQFWTHSAGEHGKVNWAKDWGEAGKQALAVKLSKTGKIDAPGQPLPHAPIKRLGPYATKASPWGPLGASDSVGAVVFDPQGRVLLRAARGGFGGARWTFPKGHREFSEPASQAALREVLEETGHRPTLESHLEKPYRGTTGTTRYYLAHNGPDAPAFDRKVAEENGETEALTWAHPEEAWMLMRGSADAVRFRDQSVLRDAVNRWHELHPEVPLPTLPEPTPPPPPPPLPKWQPKASMASTGQQPLWTPAQQTFMHKLWGKKKKGKRSELIYTRDDWGRDLRPGQGAPSKAAEVADAYWTHNAGEHGKVNWAKHWGEAGAAAWKAHWDAHAFSYQAMHKTGSHADAAHKHEVAADAWRNLARAIRTKGDTDKNTQAAKQAGDVANAHSGASVAHEFTKDTATPRGTQAAVTRAHAAAMSFAQKMSNEGALSTSDAMKLINSAITQAEAASQYHFNTLKTKFDHVWATFLKEKGPQAKVMAAIRGGVVLAGIALAFTGVGALGLLAATLINAAPALFGVLGEFWNDTRTTTVPLEFRATQTKTTKPQTQPPAGPLAQTTAQTRTLTPTDTPGAQLEKVERLLSKVFMGAGVPPARARFISHGILLLATKEKPYGMSDPTNDELQALIGLGGTGPQGKRHDWGRDLHPGMESVSSKAAQVAHKDWISAPKWKAGQALWVKKGEAAWNEHAAAEQAASQWGSGGFTVSPKTGDSPKDGYQVAHTGATDFFDESALAHLDKEGLVNALQGIIHQHISTHADRYNDPSTYLGGWRETGKLWLEPSQNVANLDAAKALGAERNQRTIWDVKKGVPIPTGGTQGVTEQARQESPPQGARGLGHLVRAGKASALPQAGGSAGSPALPREVRAAWGHDLEEQTGKAAAAVGFSDPDATEAEEKQWGKAWGHAWGKAGAAKWHGVKPPLGHVKNVLEKKKIATTGAHTMKYLYGAQEGYKAGATDKLDSVQIAAKSAPWYAKAKKAIASGDHVAAAEYLGHAHGLQEASKDKKSYEKAKGLTPHKPSGLGKGKASGVTQATVKPAETPAGAVVPAHPLEGKTVHVNHGTKYIGAFENAHLEPIKNGYMVHGSGKAVAAAPAEIHSTEEEAKAAVPKQPPTPKASQPLYGDMAQLAQMYGISTAGTGKKVGSTLGEALESKTETNPSSGPTWHQLQSMKKVPGPKGTNPAQWYEADNGDKYLVKKAKSPEHAHNEVLMGKVYEEAGIPVPHTTLATDDSGQHYIVSKGIPNLIPWKGGSGVQTLAKKGFGVDALTANHDVGGLVKDNVYTTPEGDMVRVDIGGAGKYRAQGAPKTVWGPNVVEDKSLLDSEQGKWLYGTAKYETPTIQESLKKASTLDLTKVAERAHAAGVTPEAGESLLKTLAQRQESIKTHLTGGTEPSVAPEPTSSTVSGFHAKHAIEAATLPEAPAKVAPEHVTNYHEGWKQGYTHGLTLTAPQAKAAATNKGYKFAKTAEGAENAHYLGIAHGYAAAAKLNKGVVKASSVTVMKPASPQPEKPKKPKVLKSKVLPPAPPMTPVSVFELQTAYPAIKDLVNAKNDVDEFKTGVSAAVQHAAYASGRKWGEDHPLSHDELIATVKEHNKSITKGYYTRAANLRGIIDAHQLSVNEDPLPKQGKLPERKFSSEALQAYYDKALQEAIQKIKETVPAKAAAAAQKSGSDAAFGTRKKQIQHLYDSNRLAVKQFESGDDYYQTSSWVVRGLAAADAARAYGAVEAKTTEPYKYISNLEKGSEVAPGVKVKNIVNVPGTGQSEKKITLESEGGVSTHKYYVLSPTAPMVEEHKKLAGAPVPPLKQLPPLTEDEVKAAEGKYASDTSFLSWDAYHKLYPHFVQAYDAAKKAVSGLDLETAKKMYAALPVGAWASIAGATQKGHYYGARQAVLEKQKEADLLAAANQYEGEEHFAPPVVEPEASQYKIGYAKGKTETFGIIHSGVDSAAHEAAAEATAHNGARELGYWHGAQQAKSESAKIDSAKAPLLADNGFNLPKSPQTQMSYIQGFAKGKEDGKGKTEAELLKLATLGYTNKNAAAPQVASYWRGYQAAVGGLRNDLIHHDTLVTAGEQYKSAEQWKPPAKSGLKYAQYAVGFLRGVNYGFEHTAEVPEPTDSTPRSLGIWHGTHYAKATLAKIDSAKAPLLADTGFNLPTLKSAQMPYIEGFAAAKEAAKGKTAEALEALGDPEGVSEWFLKGWKRAVAGIQQDLINHAKLVKHGEESSSDTEWNPPTKSGAKYEEYAIGYGKGKDVGLQGDLAAELPIGSQYHWQGTQLPQYNKVATKVGLTTWAMETFGGGTTQFTGVDPFKGTSNWKLELPPLVAKPSSASPKTPRELGILHGKQAGKKVYDAAESIAETFKGQEFFAPPTGYLRAAYINAYKTAYDAAMQKGSTLAQLQTEYKSKYGLSSTTLERTQAKAAWNAVQQVQKDYGVKLALLKQAEGLVHEPTFKPPSEDTGSDEYENYALNYAKGKNLGLQGYGPGESPNPPPQEETLPLPQTAAEQAAEQGMAHGQESGKKAYDAAEKIAAEFKGEPQFTPPANQYKPSFIAGYKEAHDAAEKAETVADLLALSSMYSAMYQNETGVLEAFGLGGMAAVAQVKNDKADRLSLLEKAKTMLSDPKFQLPKGSQAIQDAYRIGYVKGKNTGLADEESIGDYIQIAQKKLDEAPKGSEDYYAAQGNLNGAEQAAELTKAAEAFKSDKHYAPPKGIKTAYNAGFAEGKKATTGVTPAEAQQYKAAALAAYLTAAEGSLDEQLAQGRIHGAHQSLTEMGVDEEALLKKTFPELFSAAVHFKNYGAKELLPGTSELSDESLRKLPAYALAKEAAIAHGKTLTPEQSLTQATHALETKDQVVSSAAKAAALGAADGYREAHTVTTEAALQPNEEVPEEPEEQTLEKFPEYAASLEEAKAAQASGMLSKQLFHKAGELEAQSGPVNKAKAMAWETVAETQDDRETTVPELKVEGGHPDLTEAQVADVNQHLTGHGYPDSLSTNLVDWAYNQGRAMGITLGNTAMNGGLKAADIYALALHADDIAKNGGLTAVQRARYYGIARGLFRTAKAAHDGAGLVTTAQSKSAPKPDVKYQTPSSALMNAVAEIKKVLYKTVVKEAEFTTDEKKAMAMFTGPARWQGHPPKAGSGAGSDANDFYQALNTMLAGLPVAAPDPVNKNSSYYAKVFLDTVDRKSVPAKMVIHRHTKGQEFKPGELDKIIKTVQAGEKVNISIPISSMQYSSNWGGPIHYLIDKGALTMDGNLEHSWHPSEYETNTGGIFEIYKVEPVGSNVKLYMRQVVHFAN